MKTPSIRHTGKTLIHIRYRSTRTPDDDKEKHHHESIRISGTEK